MALRLLYWVYQHPSARAGRGSRVAGTTWCSRSWRGLALRRVPLRARIWLLASRASSSSNAYVGRGRSCRGRGRLPARIRRDAMAVTNRPGRRVVVQGVLMAAVLVCCGSSARRSRSPRILGWGFFSFAMFRHVSFVVESARGVPVTLGGYLCFLLFYPNCFGAMEVYNEFWEHNLVTERAREYRRSARMVAKGVVLLSIAVMIPTDRLADPGQRRLRLDVDERPRGLLSRRDRVDGTVEHHRGRRALSRHAAAAELPRRPDGHEPVAVLARVARHDDELAHPLRLHPARREPPAADAQHPRRVRREHHLALRGGSVPPPRHVAARSSLAPLVLWGTINFVGVAAHAATRRRRPPPQSSRRCARDFLRSSGRWRCASDRSPSPCSGSRWSGSIASPTSSGRWSASRGGSAHFSAHSTR